MKITFCTKSEIDGMVINSSEEFLSRIAAPEIFVVKEFYDPKAVLAFRQEIFEMGLSTPPSWHPLLDDCPDYHRLHDNYPNAHVKSKMHGFYFHGWYEQNARLFDHFYEIFRLKCLLAGLENSRSLRNLPSQGFVARVNFQNYPRGGGHIREHVDPHSQFALIQTLVQASEPFRDFNSGGLFARAAQGAEKIFLDYHTAPGDLLILSPAIPHGVDPVDNGEDYDWRINSGKWTILPLFVASDYPAVQAVKPREIHARKG